MKSDYLKKLLLFTLMLNPFLLAASTTKKIIISEFMALNSSIRADVDGTFSDWIELHNPGDVPIDLSGWHLTDESTNLAKWTFPTVTIAPGAYLTVWASGKDVVASNGEIHTNFKLSGSGEYLALVEPDTTNISFEYAPTYPAQLSDVSYGIYLNQPTFFKTPTPGAANSMGSQILTPMFSVGRGFFSSPFTVTLSVADPSATIRYTTDGIRPTATVGNIYKGPLNITKTTPLSAVCIKDGITSAVVSNTYLFVSDIVNQTNTPTGYPTRWGTMAFGMSTTYPAGSRAPADYGMDPDVCNSPTYKNLMVNAMTSIPSISITTNPSYLFSYSINKDTGGIYIYTGDVPYDEINIDPTKYTGPDVPSKTLGIDWERPASVEYFDPSDSSQFQINCALLLHGGNGRKAHSTPKHSFRFSFRSDYGASKLNFKLFDEKKATNQFDHLIVRAAMNYSWLHNAELQRTDAQNLTDAFSRKLQLDMGQVSGHDKFVHVFLNGMYWGVFDLTEKFNNDFMESYFGGSDTQYDVVNDDGVVDGTMTAFTSMKTYALASDYNNLVSKKLLDCPNFIDYMLMNYFIGNVDWDKNNWFAGRNTLTPENGFRLFSWDAETSLTDVTINKVTLKDGTPTNMLIALVKNEEFKLLMADRIQKHFFNGGALTPENTVYRYGQMAAKFDTAMIAESARWGDFRRDHAITATAALYTLNDHWIPRRDFLLNTYLPQRTTNVLNQLKTAGYFPSLVAPSYNTRGGEITNPVSVTISAPAGTIYYTIDGSDPRQTGGALSTKALAYTKALNVIGRGTLKARAKNGSTWSPLNEVSFKSADTVHFIGDGAGLEVLAQRMPSDIFYSDGALHYQLPTDGTVSLKLYTLDGRQAGGFDSMSQNAGVQSYGCNLLPGVYLFRIGFNDRVQTGKLVVP